MSLAPAFVADVLQRQGLISPDQAEEVKREARQMGDRVRSAATYEQKAVAYDLVSSYRFPNLKDGAGTVGEQEIARGHRRRGRARARARSTPLSLDADLIESQDLAPVRPAPPDDPARRCRTASCGSPAPTRSTSKASTPSAASPAATSSSSSPPSPRSCSAITEFYGLRHSVKRAERDLNGRHRPRQPRAARPDEERVRDRVERPAHRQRRRVHAPARLRLARERHPHRAQARVRA